MIDHFVYLANTSGLKVGITRGTQVPTRWMDQGATQALPVFRAASRLDSGLLETLFAQHVADKTAWQAMLKGSNSDLDMQAEAEQLAAACQQAIAGLQQERGLDALVALDDQPVTSIRYPVLNYPDKVKSQSFDRQEEVGGVLQGIKGQYLMFDTGVINIRKHGGYRVAVRIEGESLHA